MFLAIEETFLKLQNGSWIKILDEGFLIFKKYWIKFFFILNFSLNFCSWGWTSLETDELENKEL